MSSETGGGAWAGERGPRGGGERGVSILFCRVAIRDRDGLRAAPFCASRHSGSSISIYGA